MARGRDIKVLVGLSAFLVVVLAQVVLEGGPLVWLDIAVHDIGFEERWPRLVPMAEALEVLGQRAPTAVVAVAVVGVLAWRARSWRPLVLLAVSLLMLNCVVGGMKLVTGRLKPFHDDVELFNGGNIFPSGHASNVVVTWGMLCYLLVRYGRRPTYPVRSMAAAVVLAALAMGAVSIYLDTHWVTDILAGWGIGAEILQVTVMLDAHLRRPARSHVPAPPVPTASEPVPPQPVLPEPASPERPRPLAGSRDAGG